MTGTEGIDDLDRRLLEVVQDNGRVSLTDLGRALHLGVSATRARLQNLTDRGVITGWIGRPVALRCTPSSG
jgi:Lrp/AsnC family transcriptional regulator, leucine-responsive regulatory protein